VIATDLDIKKLSGLKVAKKVALDVRSTQAVDALAKAGGEGFGPIDILANCAGFVHHGSVLECSEQDWDFSFDLNVKSMHRTIRAFIPGMLKKKRGSIVNMRRPGAHPFAAFRTVTSTARAKPLSSALTKSVAADFIKKGIRWQCRRTRNHRSRLRSRRPHREHWPSRRGQSQKVVAAGLRRPFRPWGGSALRQEVRPISYYFWPPMKTSLVTGQVSPRRRWFRTLELRFSGAHNAYAYPHHGVAGYGDRLQEWWNAFQIDAIAFRENRSRLTRIHAG